MVVSGADGGEDFSGDGNMRKTVTMMLALILAFSLCACGKENSAAEPRETGTKRGFSALAACGQLCDFCGR